MAQDEFRSSRKLAHVELALKQHKIGITTGLEEVMLVPKALVHLDLDDVTLKTSFLDQTIDAPIYINAMTGGHEAVTKFNEAFAICARETGIPMAVGSQKAALEDQSFRSSYCIVRQMNPKGVIIGNLSAHATLEEAKLAVEMLEANALQLHLNIAQELVMTEGDRTFKNMSENIQQIVEALHVPVIVKEVGSGMSRETMMELLNLGVQMIDLGGAGGTSFQAIEYGRQMDVKDMSLLEWGLPTAYSLLEAKDLVVHTLMASGGIQSAMDIAKCLALGANLVGMAGEVLRQYHAGNDLVKWMEEVKLNLRKIMLLTGSQTPEDLKHCRKILKGDLRQYATYSRR